MRGLPLVRAIILLMKSTNIFLSTLTGVALLGATCSHAQMVGGSVFLKGNYVEAGICSYGDFGAATPPAGYHPHTTSSGGGALGFVADPAMDGWGTGTPAYAGDFFTPGYPFEGFNIQIGSLRAQSQSCMSFSGTGLSGSNVSYAAVGSKLIGVWEGTFDSMTVKQETTLDTAGLYFTMKITLINNASVAKNDIYYLRSVDPDNDESWGGSFATLNTIEYQLPNPLNATVVSATGTTYSSAYLALGTADTNAKCLTYTAWPITSTTDLSTIFSGSYLGTYTMGSSSISDIAIGLAFRVAHIAPVDSASDSVAYKTTTTVYPQRHPANEASFTYFYAFSPDAVDSALAYLSDSTGWVGDTTSTVDTGTGGTTHIRNINERRQIHAYPNPVRETINIAGLLAGDHLAIFDMMGREVHTGWTPETKDVNTFSMARLPAGNYVLIVSDDTGTPRSRIPLRKI